MPAGNRRVVLVTGGTGFIGRRLVKRLLLRKNSDIYLLTRKSSFPKVEQLIDSLLPEIEDANRRIHPVAGDITRQNLLENGDELKKVQKKTQEIFHLAARYELGISKEAAMKANVDGTLNVLE